MKNSCLILITVPFLLSFSCTKEQTVTQLNNIESYIEDRPDSALITLQSLPKTESYSKRELARFSLLYAMALDKNYIDTADISIIQPAIDFFEKHGGADDKMKAYYYQGIAYLNQKDYPSAIISFTNAEEMIPYATDMRYVGLVYSRIADLYNISRNAEEDLKYISRAAKAFENSGIEKYKYSTLLRKGEALMGLSKYKEAEDAILQVISCPTVSDYILNLAKEDYALLLVSQETHEADKALKLFQEVIKASGKLRNINSWAAYAYSLAVCGYKDQSDQLFSHLYSTEKNDYSIVDIWRSAVFRIQGDYHKAYSLLQKSLSYQDSLMRITISQATSRAQKDFLSLKNSQIQIENRTKQLRLILIILLLIISLIAVFLVFRIRSDKLKKERIELIDIAETMRFRLQESENERAQEKENLDDLLSLKDSEISSLRREIHSKESILSHLRTEYVHMYKSQFKYLGSLCETFLFANERTDSQRIVYERVRDMIKDISNDAIGQRRFERMIDKSLNNIMKRFREDFPKYSEEDYRFVSYLFVGFDATTLSVIFNMPSVAAVYMKKSRIKKTVQESEVSFKSNYLEMLS